MSAPEGYIDGGMSRAGWSSVGTMLRCMRLYALKTRGSAEARAIISAPSKGQALGTVLHSGLTHYYGRQGARTPEGVWVGNSERRRGVASILDPYEAMRYTAEVEVERGAPVPLADLQADAVRVFDAYGEHWAARERFQVIAVESVFSVDFVDPLDGTICPYTARVDLVILENRRYGIIDHKCHAQIDKGTAVPYSLSGQIHGLTWLGRQFYGETFGGVGLNLVQTQGPAKFLRPPLDPAPALVRDFEMTVVDAYRRKRQLEQEGRAPERWTPTANDTVCVDRYGICKAARFCRGMA